MLRFHRMPLGIFRHPAEIGGQRAHIIVNAFTLFNISIVICHTAEVYKAGRYPHGGMHMAEELHLPVEIAGWAEHKIGNTNRQVKRDFVIF